MLKKKYIVLLILSLLFCVGRVLINVLTGYVTKTNITISSNLSLEMGTFVFEILLPLIAFMACTDLFATEIQEDTIKASLMRPITRLKLMSAKAAAAFCMCAAMAFLIFIVCSAIQAFGGAFKIGYIFTSFAAYLLNMIPVIAVILLSVLINLLVKSPALVMFLSLAVYVFMKYMSIYGGKIGSIFFVGYMQWHRIWMGMTLPFASILMKSGIVVGSMIILFTISYLLFDKKEF